jgi:hypothetical protein
MNMNRNMKLNLDGKIFKSISNTSNGEVDSDTIFYYHQKGDKVWAEYSGGSVSKGQLIAIMKEHGVLDMKYHHINTSNQLMIGECISTPVINNDGKVVYREKWQWLNGDRMSGHSEIVEQ